MTSKQQINIRASDLTRRQIEELAEMTGMTITELVTLAVDRLHNVEVKMKLKKRLSGSEKTRGDNGVRADVAHRVVWNPEINGYEKWEPGNEWGNVNDTEWGVFDPDFGWIVGNW